LTLIQHVHRTQLLLRREQHQMQTQTLQPRQEALHKIMLPTMRLLAIMHKFIHVQLHQLARRIMREQELLSQTERQMQIHKIEQQHQQIHKARQAEQIHQQIHKAHQAERIHQVLQAEQQQLLVHQAGQQVRVQVR